MKTLLMIGMMAFAGLSFQPAPLADSTTEISTCQHGQCSAIAKSTGKQCKNCCQKGSTKCWNHRD